MSEFDALRGAFIEEALDLLDQLQESLLALERAPRDAESVDCVFRALHTIKGCGSMFGYDDITVLAHEVENAYQSVRSGKLDVTRALIDSTLHAADAIREMVVAIADGTTQVDAIREGAMADFARGAGPGEAAPLAPDRVPISHPTPAPVAGERRLRVDFGLPGRSLASGGDPVEILDQLRRLGDCVVYAQAADLPALDKMDPGTCYMRWTVEITGSVTVDDVRDVFLFASDAEVSIEELASGDAAQAGGDTAAEGTDADAAGQSAGTRAVQATSLRVTPAKLDELVDLVGELVTAQARLTQLAEGNVDASVVAVAEEIERLTGLLRDSVLDIRMVPIGSMFGKFARLVRDLSANLGKHAELFVEGGETELDKTVIDRINEPLVHIVRNAIDHGIESPDARVASGKSATGQIRLAAYQSGGEVVIEVSDDGAGLDMQRILEKAVERGVIATGDDVDPAAVADLLFAPGFSTAREVTNVSGRGVGLDVVKRTVEDLRGAVHIEQGRDGGTVTRINLPLTLAIIEGLLVDVAGERYIIPLDAVDECIDLADHGVSEEDSIVNLRGKPVACVRLRESFSLDANGHRREIAVIARVGDDKVGLVVDEVIGQHQTVIKSLGRVHRDATGISGATILGDGTVALILDVVKLARSAEARQALTSGRGC